MKVSYTFPISFQLDTKEKIKSESVSDDEKVYTVCDIAPEFPGGEIALRKWIAENLKYPVEAAKNGEQGKVYVTFVVSKEGTVEKARIARGVTPLLNEEAIRVISASPKWKPGYQKGKPVAVSYTVPINFKLQ